MQYLTEAVSLFRTHPRLWKYAVKPLLWTLGLFLVLVAAGYSLFVPVLRDLFGRVSSSDLTGLLAVAVYALIWVFLAGTIFLAIGGFMSSLMWDRLSMEVEEIAVGSAPNNQPPLSTVLRDSAMRSVFALGVSSIALCCGFFAAGIPGILGAGLIGLFEFTAGYYIRRGVTFQGQWGRVRKLDGWAPFVVMAGVLSLVPFVNFVMLPILVAAGTLMATRSESA